MYEVLGIGTDLCAVRRMEALLEDERFLKRWFTPEEADYIRGKGRSGAQSMAGIFAAKEALLKALGTGIDTDLREIGVAHTAAGAPYYVFDGSMTERTAGLRTHLSITHEEGMAAAFCVIEKEVLP